MLPILAALSFVAPVVAAPAASTWLPAYDLVREALVADQVEATHSAALALATAAAGDDELVRLATAVAAAPDAPGERTAFAALSRAVISRAAADSSVKLKVYHCPMFAGYGYWVQPKAGIANPYMGQSMPECGEEVSMKQAVKAAG